MKNIRIIAVGKLKTAHWQQAARHYQSRIENAVSLTIDIVKDASPALAVSQKKQAEGRAILGLLRPGETLLCLDERGRDFTSEQFARFIQSLTQINQKPCFVIGGAFGLSEEVKKTAGHVLSLGPMTFPHELARVILLEQIYRAERILAGSGYHH